MVTLNQVRQGSIVRVRGDFGSGPAVRARVDAVCEDVKNGYPGIDYTVLSDNDERWAYLDQVVSVDKY